jgi:Tol biopolymer transport system component
MQQLVGPGGTSGLLSDARRVGLSGLGVVLAVLVAACGATSEPGTPSGAEPNETAGTADSSTPTTAPGKSPTPTGSPHTADPADGGCKPNAPRPGNGRIAFAGNSTTDVNSELTNAPGDIYTAEPDGTDQRQLTHTLDATYPTWSPDGEQIAFVRIAWRANYTAALWLMNSDGSGQRRITNSGSGVYSLDWAPHGNRIALTKASGIWMVDAATGNTRRLPWSVPGWQTPGGPRWSADGKHLAVTSAKKGGGLTPPVAIFTVNSRTGRDAALVPGAHHNLGHDWSWTHCRMIFASGLRDPSAQCAGDLFVTDSDLGNVQLLRKQRCWQAAPIWSPDGNNIAYESNGGIWIADADGSNAHQIIEPLRTKGNVPGWNGNAALPAWQPTTTPTKNTSGGK